MIKNLFQSKKNENKQVKKGIPKVSKRLPSKTNKNRVISKAGSANKRISNRQPLNKNKYRRPKTRVMTANVSNRGGFLQDVASFAVSFLISGIVIALLAISYGVLVKNIPLDKFLNRTFSTDISLKSIFAPINEDQGENNKNESEETINLKYEIRNETKDNLPKKSTQQNKTKQIKSNKGKGSKALRKKTVKVPSYNYDDEPIQIEVNRYIKDTNSNKVKERVSDTSTEKSNESMNKNLLKKLNLLARLNQKRKNKKHQAARQTVRRKITESMQRLFQMQESI